MNPGKWSTKEDVQKDLAEATGRMLHIDNNYLVVGERPPPQYSCEIDEEMQLMFGDSTEEKLSDFATSPDLKGITQMLRMVQECDDASDFDTNVNTSRSTSVCDVIRISKLNPNVQEFKPRGSTTKPVANKPEGTEASVDILDPNLPKIRESENGKVHDVTNSEFVNGHTDINRNDIVQKNLQAYAEKSKDKTVDTSTKKKERNVAIANLQNLLAKENGDGNKDTELVKTIKLITPDYYEHSKAEIDEEKRSESNLEEKKNDEVSDVSVCGFSVENTENKHHTNLKTGERTSSDPCISNINHVKLEKKTLSTGTVNKTHCSASEETLLSDKDLSDPQIIESINKVNNWLNINERKQEGSPVEFDVNKCLSPKPIPHLEKVVFKRKEVRKSPNVPEKVAAPPKNNIEQYKPSEYAQKLNKMYTERLQKIERTKVKNGWGNLEDLLKEKDEKIKLKKLQDQSNGSEIVNV